MQSRSMLECHHERCRGQAIRRANHPPRPANYLPPDAFWEKRGHRKVSGLAASFRWKDIDRPEESEHPMQFCLRELA